MDERKVRQEAILNIRKEYGLTQMELAVVLGTVPGVISRWEGGNHRVSDAYWQIIRSRFPEFFGKAVKP